MKLLHPSAVYQVKIAIEFPTFSFFEILFLPSILYFGMKFPQNFQAAVAAPTLSFDEVDSFVVAALVAAAFAAAVEVKSFAVIAPIEASAVVEAGEVAARKILCVQNSWKQQQQMW